MASLNEVSVCKKYVNIKMRCPQSFPDINRKEVKLIPKPLNTILSKIEVKNKNSSQTKLLSAHEKQKTSSNQAYNEEITRKHITATVIDRCQKRVSKILFSKNSKILI